MDNSVKTPCVAACKNEGGICSGCYRTIDEIVQWQHVTEQERDLAMKALSGELSSHVCPQCGENAQCDISAGHETCWCFKLEKRDTSDLKKGDPCLCRKCLSRLPIQ